MPRTPNSGGSTLADTVCKIIDLQEEINRDIDRLVDLKREIMSVIKAVDDAEYQILLEKRYLCFQTWEQIAAEMNYGVRYVHLHACCKALLAVEALMKQVCCK